MIQQQIGKFSPATSELAHHVCREDFKTRTLPGRKGVPVYPRAVAVLRYGASVLWVSEDGTFNLPMGQINPGSDTYLDAASRALQTATGLSDKDLRPTKPVLLGKVTPELGFPSISVVLFVAAWKSVPLQGENFMWCDPRKVGGGAGEFAVVPKDLLKLAVAMKPTDSLGYDNDGTLSIWTPEVEARVLQINTKQPELLPA